MATPWIPSAAGAISVTLGSGERKDDLRNLNAPPETKLSVTARIADLWSLAVSSGSLFWRSRVDKAAGFIAMTTSTSGTATPKAVPCPKSAPVQAKTSASGSTGPISCRMRAARRRTARSLASVGRSCCTSSSTAASKTSVLKLGAATGRTLRCHTSFLPALAARSMMVGTASCHALPKVGVSPVGCSWGDRTRGRSFFVAATPLPTVFFFTSTCRDCSSANVMAPASAKTSCERSEVVSAKSSATAAMRAGLPRAPWGAEAGLTSAAPARPDSSPNCCTMAGIDAQKEPEASFPARRLAAHTDGRSRVSRRGSCRLMGHAAGRWWFPGFSGVCW
mmetsp:Transcript_51905/g.134168  ORF Transcript_51905/g.134168 Transcript_51905/m.134168 type:complete len:335 (-) Transcript_51905:62-1066(-)